MAGEPATVIRRGMWPDDMTGPDVPAVTLCWRCGRRLRHEAVYLSDPEGLRIYIDGLTGREWGRDELARLIISALSHATSDVEYIAIGAHDDPRQLRVSVNRVGAVTRMVYSRVSKVLIPEQGDVEAGAPNRSADSQGLARG